MSTKTTETSRILNAADKTAWGIRGPLLVLERLLAKGRIVPAWLDLIELRLPPEQLHEISISEALAEQREEG